MEYQRETKTLNKFVIFKQSFFFLIFRKWENEVNANIAVEYLMMTMITKAMKMLHFELWHRL